MFSILEAKLCFFSYFSPTCIILYYICSHDKESIMLNHCKSLIFNKLRSEGGVNSRFSAEGNDRKVVSVTPYYINTLKASKAGRRGSVVDAFLCRFALLCAKHDNPRTAALRHCEEARRSNPGNKLMVWIASFLAMTRSASGGEVLQS